METVKVMGTDVVDFPNIFVRIEFRGLFTTLSLMDLKNFICDPKTYSVILFC